MSISFTRIALLLPLLLICILLAPSSRACTGNCVACHPGLHEQYRLNDDHDALKTCTDCHQDTGVDIGQSSCGTDCFSCHDIDETTQSDPAHAVLPGCIECHQVERPSDLSNEPVPASDFMNQIMGSPGAPTQPPRELPQTPRAQ